MAQPLTAEQIRLSHTIDDAERMRGKVLRAAKEIDRLLPDLIHAVKHGRTIAAADMLVTLDRYNQTVLDATKPADN